jgi:hypothetical protein
MTGKRHPTIEGLKMPVRELTPEEAEAAEGGIIAILIDAGLTVPRAPGLDPVAVFPGENLARWGDYSSMN